MFHRVIPRSTPAPSESSPAGASLRIRDDQASLPITPTDGAAAPPSRPGDMSRLVREGLAAHRIQLEFQPIAVVRADTRIASHEGFVQILDEGGRAIPASRFIGAVEGSTLGRELDSATLRLGLQGLRADPTLRLAINASARSLGNGTWRATLEEGAAELGPRLTLELGEGSTALLADRAARFMQELRPRGLGFVLDDFGSGPLPLRQLRDLRFDGVKIDASFIRGIGTSPDNQALVGALVTAAHRFGMFAVGKGVETHEEAGHLRDLGVDGLQGYLFGRPGPRP